MNDEQIKIQLEKYKTIYQHRMSKRKIIYLVLIPLFITAFVGSKEEIQKFVARIGELMLTQIADMLVCINSVWIEKLLLLFFSIILALGGIMLLPLLGYILVRFVENKAEKYLKEYTDNLNKLITNSEPVRIKKTKAS